MSSYTKGHKIIRIICISISTVVIFIGVQLLSFYLKGTTVSAVWKIKSKTHAHQAFFVHQGVMGPGSLKYFIADPDPKIKGDEIVLSPIHVGDASPKFKNAVWSKDETVLAVRTSGNFVLDGEKNAKKAYYTHAYDFKENKAIYKSRFNFRDEDPFESWNNRRQQIEDLINERGGAGQTLGWDSLESNMNNLFFGSFRFKKLLDEYLEKGMEDYEDSFSKYK